MKKIMNHLFYFSCFFLLGFFGCCCFCFFCASVIKCPVFGQWILLLLMIYPCVFLFWWSISLLKPYSPLTGVQVSTAADWPLFLVVSRLAFFFFCCWGWWCNWCVCVCVCVLVCVCARVRMFFPDLELVPFKTLLNTFMWDWFYFASTTAPSSSFNPKGNPGRQKQSVGNEVFDGILNAIRSQICVVYCIWYTLLDSYVNLH